MTTQKLRKIASEMGRPAIIKALRKKAAQMSKTKGMKGPPSARRMACNRLSQFAFNPLAHRQLLLASLPVLFEYSSYLSTRLLKPLSDSFHKSPAHYPFYFFR